MKKSYIEPEIEVRNYTHPLGYVLTSSDLNGGDETDFSFSARETNSIL